MNNWIANRLYGMGYGITEFWRRDALSQAIPEYARRAQGVGTAHKNGAGFLPHDGRIRIRYLAASNFSFDNYAKVIVQRMP